MFSSGALVAAISEVYAILVKGLELHSIIPSLGNYLS